MKRLRLFKVTFFVFAIFIIIIAPLSVTFAEQYRAVSLKMLQEKLRPGSYSRDVMRFAGMTRAIGFIVDESNHDLIIFGQVESGFSPLYLTDFVIALRNTWLRYAAVKGGNYQYIAPYCSLEPDPAIVDQLRSIGSLIYQGDSAEEVESAVEEWRKLCQTLQSVVIKGIPFYSHFASVMVKADYDMKLLAIGCNLPRISGFKSLADMTLEEAKNDLIKNGSVKVTTSIGDRFWFYPGEIRFLEHEGVFELKKLEILLLTEESFLSKSNEISGEGKSSELAEDFSALFTSMYGDLADERDIYIELENLFDILALSKGIKFRSFDKKAQVNMAYLLDQLKLPRTSVDRYMQGESSVKKFEHSSKIKGGRQTAKLWIPFCGGVSMKMEINENNFEWDSTGKLSRIKQKVLSGRPNSKSLFWNFHQ